MGKNYIPMEEKLHSYGVTVKTGGLQPHSLPVSHTYGYYYTVAMQNNYKKQEEKQTVEVCKDDNNTVHIMACQYLDAFVDDKWRLRVDWRVVDISLRRQHDDLCAEIKFSH